MDENLVNGDHAAGTCERDLCTLSLIYSFIQTRAPYQQISIVRYIHTIFFSFLNVSLDAFFMSEYYKMICDI